eukprot:TRINITY_DN2951_c0_g1_i5.p1 TRINITY_DN2951_c0_g1~~TRINITY_DN2951_c0_g1_i5.p1  ORF type:complete len:336 (-),score=88.81 TRINITY_DN2951_c0_g1_i5:53-1060(-)
MSSTSDNEDIFEMDEEHQPSQKEKSLKSSSDKQQQATPIQMNDDGSWVSNYIKEASSKNPEISLAAVAVQILCEVIKTSKATTLMGLREDLITTAEKLKKFNSSLSLSSSCELFTRFVTRTSLDIPDFEQCKARLIERGDRFIQKTDTSRQTIAELGHPFITDGARVLVHGYSRCVCNVLAAAAAQNKRFTVYVTESRPDGAGELMAQRLEKSGVSVECVVLDAAVAHMMEQVDMVLVGAEAVVESGGIINKIGTYQLSIVAKAFNRPFYVTSESFKFTRLYPLKQKDFPNTYKTNTKGQPYLDYTPPSYITLLFTDLGVLTPSAVSDELIKLYY